MDSSFNVEEQDGERQLHASPSFTNFTKCLVLQVDFAPDGLFLRQSQLNRSSHDFSAMKGGGS